MSSPILLFHICSGTVGLLAGAAAVVFRKGSYRHRVAGNVFVIAMLGLSASGAYLGFMKSQPGNVLGGALTFYLVTTAWMTARRKTGETGLRDWGALLVVAAVGAVNITFGFEALNSPAGLIHGYPAGPYFFLGSVAVLSAVGDVRMLMTGGLSATQRVARHLWRMCFALFIASSSVFRARAQLFPAFMSRIGILPLLGVLPLILMIFWLIRVRFATAYKKAAGQLRSGISPLPDNVVDARVFGVEP